VLSAYQISFAIDERARGGNDEAYQEIEKDFCSQAKSEWLGEQHVQLICSRQQTAYSHGKQAVAPEDPTAEYKVEAGRLSLRVFAGRSHFPWCAPTVSLDLHFRGE
jgi:hypothetical protein